MSRMNWIWPTALSISLQAAGFGSLLRSGTTELRSWPRSLAAIAADSSRHSTSFRSEEHTSELQSLMRISYAVFCLKKKKTKKRIHSNTIHANKNTEYTNKKKRKRPTD